METSEEDLQIFLIETPEQQRFFCNDGQVFSTVEELGNALDSMNDEVFLFHVNEDKNDFSNWIYDVIGDVWLAENLRKVTDKKSTARHVKKRVAHIKKKSKRN